MIFVCLSLIQIILLCALLAECKRLSASPARTAALAEPDDEEEADRLRRRMDEGVTNLMSYEPKVPEVKLP
ncbi:hypothetical protein KQI82_06390 [Oscillibacter sp. MSJ-2]|uniref:Uncharacterized protein n=1 Tax=Dysosmobacter acutus TaxID=2841504 RepID=A0ABS6F8P8_9FIRM|nr:hypothetical protein [Dysosmobacter acutus]MBU5626547.1 hypothetical protein [Dysosmobacter acutus]